MGFNGDQMSMKTLRAAKLLQSGNDETTQHVRDFCYIYEKLGPFHWIWTYLKVIFEKFWHTNKDVGGIAYIANMLKKNKKLRGAKIFFKAESMLMIILQSHMAAYAVHKLSTLNLNNSRDHFVGLRDGLPTGSSITAQTIVDIACNFVDDTAPGLNFDNISTCRQSFNSMSRMAFTYFYFKDSLTNGNRFGTFRGFKMGIPAFLGTNHGNYWRETVRLLLNVLCDLSPRHSLECFYSMTVNTTGKPDGNIAQDLHMEHQVGYTKDYANVSVDIDGAITVPIYIHTLSICTPYLYTHPVYCLR